MTSYDLSGSGVSWAVRESFIRYVSQSGGSIDIDEPASTHSAGFSWPVTAVEGTPDDERGRVRLGGGVHIQAHGGLLDVALVDMEVRTADGILQLVVGAEGAERVLVSGAFRAVQSVEGVSAWVVDEPALHADAVDWFGGSYQAGAPFAPLLLALREDHLAR